MMSSECEAPAIITVNGLTRGGTNLTSSLLQAQRGIVCGDIGVFELPLLMESIPNSLSGSMIDETGRMELEKEFDRFIEKTVQQAYKILMPNMRLYRDGFRTNATAYCGINIQDWIEYYIGFYEARSFEDFDRLAMEFSRQHNLTALASRITGCTPYVQSFLDRSDRHYWIEVVRDPMARFYSAKRGHLVLPEDSFRLSRWQLELIESIEHPRLQVIAYEDLVRDPEKVLRLVMKMIGNEDEEIICTPMTPDGGTFYGNSSDNENVFNQDRTRTPIYTSSISAYEGKLSAYENYVARYNGFQRELSPVSKSLYRVALGYRALLDGMATFFVLLSVFFKYLSVIAGCVKYAGRGGYALRKVLQRVYVDFSSKYSRWRF